MKLGSFKTHSGNMCTGVNINGQLIDLTAAFEKYLFEDCGVGRQFASEASYKRIPPSMLALIQREEEGMADLTAVYSYIKNIMKKGSVLFSPSGKKLNYGLDEIKLLCPIPQVYRVFNIGVNCDAFAAMAKVTPPEEGYTCMFKKPTHSIIGPEDEIQYPITGNDVESEIELGVIFGKKGKGISQDKAMDYIFGYTISHDIVVMDVLSENNMGPADIGVPASYYITMSKSPDTFEPIGPFIVTKDEIPDPQNVDMELRVNGEVRLKGRTRDMRVPIRRLIEFNSADMTFYPGDFLSTGGMGDKDWPPHTELKPGDVVEAEIKEIGVLRNYVIS